MADNASLSLPVVIEVSPSLEVALRRRRAESFRDDLVNDINRLLGYLGLPGKPLVEVRGAGGPRSVRIWVHGVLQSFDRDLASRVWLTAAPPDLRHIAQSSLGDTASERGAWFDDYVKNLSEQSDGRLVSEYLRQLVVQVIRGRPGCLVGLGQASAYRVEASSREAIPESVAVSSESTLLILQSLLNLGVKVDKAEIWQTIMLEHQSGRSAEAIVEALFSRFRSDSIEIHISREYLSNLLKPTSMTPDSQSRPEGLAAKIRSFFLRGPDAKEADERLRPLLPELEEQFRSDFGLLIPKVKWVVDLNGQSIAFKVNDILGPPTLGLRPNEVLAHSSMRELESLGIQGMPTVSPSDGKECAVVNATAQDIVNQNDIRTSDPFEFIALALLGDLSHLAGRLLSSDVVEFQLAQLEKEYPVLVREILSRYSLTDVTQVARGLVAEGVPFRTPRAILEKFLEFETISVDDNLYRVFDDRLPVGDNAQRSIRRNEDYREFIRAGLRNDIIWKYSDNWSLSAITVRLESAKSGHQSPHRVPRFASELDVTTREKFIDRIRDALAAKPVSCRPVLLTTSMLRPLVRQIVAGELPDLPVVADRELPPDINVTVIANIYLLANNDDIEKNVGVAHVKR